MPDWFIPTIKSIIHTNIPARNRVPIMFEFSHEAAIHNQWVLEQYDCDINNLIPAHPNSILSYGSEFRSPKAPASLLRYHPR
jgi:hypothetical protein